MQKLVKFWADDTATYMYTYEIVNCLRQFCNRIVNSDPQGSFFLSHYQGKCLHTCRRFLGEVRNYISTLRNSIRKLYFFTLKLSDISRKKEVGAKSQLIAVVLQLIVVVTK